MPADEPVLTKPLINELTPPPSFLLLVEDTKLTL